MVFQFHSLRPQQPANEAPLWVEGSDRRGWGEGTLDATIHSPPPTESAFQFKGQLERSKTLAPQDASRLFISDYTASRAQFLSLADATDAEVWTQPLSAVGPKSEPLSIDIALVGSRIPTRVVFHLSGTHGVEGILGAAIQAEILKAQPSHLPGAALVFVHCLNPYGMAWGRRNNENGVDLNRNFAPRRELRQGAPAGYEVLKDYLVPDGDLPKVFSLETVFRILRHGFDPLKQAVLHGQFKYPDGLFFGGRELEESSRHLRDYVRGRLNKAERVIGIDVHSGMGPRNGQTVFYDRFSDDDRVAPLEWALATNLTTLRPGYQKPVGALGDELPGYFDSGRVDWLLQEFGTYSALKVLDALARENWLHHRGTQEQRSEYRSTYQSVFIPESARWRANALRLGIELVENASRAVLL